ncbi:MAG: NAD-dependent epimerase/dehydratase family protein [Desulfobacterales bacterium]|nr:NAD-dependent epimerase/dehydratase family protein [Desulfobacterales bacterium]
MLNSRSHWVLVTGATGSVGPKLVNRLCDMGYRVRTLSLDEPETDLFPDEVEVQVGDITDVATVKKAMEGIRIVFHLAALLHITNPTELLEREYMKINVIGTKTLVDAAVQAGVNRLVFFSTISVYGSSNGRIINESTPARPDTIYSKTKLSAEKVVLNARSKEDQPFGVVLRFEAVYGARVKGNYKRLVHSLASNRFIPIGKGKNRRTLIYIKDVALATILAAQHPEAAGKIYNVTDGKVHSVYEIINAICHALERIPPKLFLPLWPVKMVANIADGIMGLLGPSSPGLRNSLDKYCEDIAVDGSRIMRDLGFRPEYNLLEGWKEAIKENPIKES